MLKYDSVAELVNEAEKRGLKLSELVLKSQAQIAEKTEAGSRRPYSCHEG